MIIPKRLQQDEFRFIKVRPKSKIPLELAWQKDANYKWDSPELIKHIESGGNYGVLLGEGDLIVIDSDLTDTQKVVDSKLPPTFKVKTGKGYHNYYICKDISKKYVLKDTLKGHFGEIQYKGTQVVGAGSIHPDGHKYSVESNTQIASITENQLLRALWDLLKDDDKTKILSSRTKVNGESDPLNQKIKDNVPLTDLLRHYKYNLNKNPTMCQLGHESASGACFSYNDKLWYCFHCGKGGDIFNLVQEQEKVNFYEAKKILAEKIGVNIEPERLETPKPLLYTGSEILSGDMPEIKWLVQDIVPSKGIVIFGGTSGSYKTWTGLQLAMAVSSGKFFINMFPAKQGRVLYIDEENGETTFANRLHLLRNGYEYTHDFSNLFISIFNNVKLDSFQGATMLNTLIDGVQPQLVIIDSMVRCMEGEEDKATDVRRIFENLKVPFNKHKDIVFVILHHTVKSNSKTMMGLRGSGDFAAFSDVVLMFDTSHNGFVNVNIAKNRHIDLQKLSAFTIKIDSDNDSFIRLSGNESGKMEGDNVSLCANDIKSWLANQEVSSFKTNSLISTFKNYGFSRDCVFKALKILQDDEIVKKTGHGIYQSNFNEFIVSK